MKHKFLIPLVLILALLIVFNKKITLSEEHLDCVVQLSEVDWEGKKYFDEDNIEEEGYYRALGMMADKNERRSLHLYKKLNMKYTAYIEIGQYENCEYNSNITLLTCKPNIIKDEAWSLTYDFTSKKLETVVSLPKDDGIYVLYECK